MRIGLDLVHIPSFRQKVEDAAFVRRVFHASEVEDGRVEHLAGVFAAKEALFKADNRVNAWLDVEVQKTREGPMILCPALKDGCVVLSITHERDYACAVVVIHEERP